MEILRLFPGKSLAFVGLSKNAGKTTAMCQVARTLNGIHQLGLVSIGVDGEKKNTIWITMCQSWYRGIRIFQQRVC